MHYEPFLPITASVPWVLGVFVGCLFVFHIALVQVWKLQAVSWKRVDYVWLGITALGLLGAVSEVRRMVADNQIATQRSILVSAYDDLRREIHFMTSAAVCRQFVRSEHSPQDFDAIQREYDSVCQFAKQLQSRVPSDPPADLQGLALTERPRVTDDVLRNILDGLDRESESYIRARRAFNQTLAATQRNSLDVTLVFLWPLLLAVALALRITKVTGEIRLQA